MIERGSLLSLKRFGVAFGDHVVLANVHMEIAPRGVHVVLGPAGTGKSTLLRTLAGLNESQPSLRRWGQAHYRGLPLGGPGSPSLVQQNARLLASTLRENLVSVLPDRGTLSVREQTVRVGDLLDAHGLSRLVARLHDDVISLGRGEQRLIAIVRAASSGVGLLMVDEPTAGLDDADSADVLALLKGVAQDRALLVVTHHKEHAKALGGTGFLLAGGRVVERAPTRQLLSSPTTDAGRSFVETGSCPDPSPGARAGDLDEGVAFPTPVPPAMRGPVTSAAPRGFYWLERHRIGGLPRPGIVAELEEDLTGLARLGVTVLVTLEERQTVPVEALAPHGIRLLWFPIPDMEAPGVEAARELCTKLEEILAAGEVVGVHCLAGLGRTGTVLGAYLVWRGASALEAIETVRAIRPRSIQSEAQAQFLVRFAEARAHRVDAPHPAGTKRGRMAAEEER